PIQGETKRRAFGFHWDENRSTAPGSAGCVVFATKADVGEFVRQSRRHDPRQLVVDHGLGKVPKAPGAIKKPVQTKETFPLAGVTLNGSPIGTAVIIDGVTYPTMATVCNLLGASLEWDGKTKTLNVTK